MARFQILSLIGGGIRGAFVTSLLYEMEQKLGRPIAESFDLIAGTSNSSAGKALQRRWPMEKPWHDKDAWWQPVLANKKGP